jgi:hypothetical protein
MPGPTRSLFTDERFAYRSAIFMRATARDMIREHNAGQCVMAPWALGKTMDIIVDQTRIARHILQNARARMLGYYSSPPAKQQPCPFCADPDNIWLHAHDA